MTGRQAPAASERRVGPNGLLSPSDTAVALSVSRVYVYRLIWDGKLRTVKRDGRLAIPLSSIEAFNAKRQRGERWLHKERCHVEDEA